MNNIILNNFPDYILIYEKNTNINFIKIFLKNIYTNAEDLFALYDTCYSEKKYTNNFGYNKITFTKYRFIREYLTNILNEYKIKNPEYGSYDYCDYYFKNDVFLGSKYLPIENVFDLINNYQRKEKIRSIYE